MLELHIRGRESWDEEKEEFLYDSADVKLEHSLVSLSKWESKYCKPFLSREEKTPEETIDYIRFMALNEVSHDVFDFLTESDMRKIEKYIESPMTATTFSKDPNRYGSSEQVTAELVYYWMIALNIPFECQYWHLNKRLTLIRVCNIKNQSPKKRSARDIMNRNAALNSSRRKKYNTRG